MKEPFPQNIIAMIWDFDKTMSPDYMQQVLFDEYQQDGKQFWKEVNALPEKYKQQGCQNVTTELIYLNHIIDYVQQGKFPGLSNDKLKELGKKIVFYPGLPDFLEHLKTLVKERYTKQHNLVLEHYVVSTGLKKLIEGSAVAKHLDGIWGCEFLESDQSTQRQISGIGYVLDDTTKTRAIFEINKGVNKNQAISVNDSIAEEKRRVPISHIIYIADGPSDVPVFSVVNKHGGKTYGVYNPGEQKKFNDLYELQNNQRINGMAEADFRSSAHAARWLERSVCEIAEQIVKQRKRDLEDSVAPAPTH